MFFIVSDFSPLLWYLVVNYICLLTDTLTWQNWERCIINTVGQDLIITEILILWFRFYTSCSKQSKFISRLLDVSYIFDVIVNKMPTCWHIFFIFTPFWFPELKTIITYNCWINLKIYYILQWVHISVNIFGWECSLYLLPKQR